VLVASPSTRTSALGTLIVGTFASSCTQSGILRAPHRIESAPTISA
jgi:hypothetical protein